MDWNNILMPIYLLAITMISTMALNWLRKFLKEKYGIILDDAQFEAAKRAVLTIEEVCLNKKLACKGEEKKAMAISNLMAVRPELTPENAEIKIDNAVAVLPNVGATSIYKKCNQVEINTSQPAG